MSYIFEAIADVRLTTENIQKVIKMYPRDNDWRKLITKHRRDIDALRRGKDLPKKVEDELMQWALDNGEIKSDDVDELDDFIDSIINEGIVNENPERTPAVKAARKAHKAGTWDGNVDKEGNPIVHLRGKPYTVVMDESVNENYNQDLVLATKNVARLSNNESGQDKKDYQAVSRALAQGNLGAVKKVIKGISTKEIQADLLNILVGYNDLIAKMYPKAVDSKGNLKSGMSVDKMIKEDEDAIYEGLKKSGKGTIDIDYIGDSNLTKKLERKFKIKIKQTGQTTADISGDYKNIISFLKNNYLMDDGEIEDTFSELGEEVEEINEGLPNQKQLEKDVMDFMKAGRSDGITGLTGISKSLEQKYKVGPAAARSAVKKLFNDIVDGTYKG